MRTRRVLLWYLKLASAKLILCFRNSCGNMPFSPHVSHTASQTLDTPLEMHPPPLRLSILNGITCQLEEITVILSSHQATATCIPYSGCRFCSRSSGHHTNPSALNRVCNIKCSLKEAAEAFSYVRHSSAAGLVHEGGTRTRH